MDEPLRVRVREPGADLIRDVVGLSYNEIADSLETTLATVKWRIFKAREEVQLSLAREGITFGKDADVEPAVSAS